MLLSSFIAAFKVFIDSFIHTIFRSLDICRCSWTNSWRAGGGWYGPQLGEPFLGKTGASWSVVHHSVPSRRLVERRRGCQVGGTRHVALEHFRRLQPEAGRWISVQDHPQEPVRMGRGSAERHHHRRQTQRFAGVYQDPAGAAEGFARVWHCFWMRGKLFNFFFFC